MNIKDGSMKFLIIFASAALVACSNGGWIINSELADQVEANGGGRSPASQKISYSVAPTVGNPCSGMRFLKTAATNAQIYRCNVVLNPQVNKEAKMELQEADLCVSFYTIPDDHNNPTPAFQLNGLLLSMKEVSTSKVLKNMVIRSSRMSGEPTEKSNELDYLLKKDSTEISDLVPLSGGKQKITFDYDKKILSYETFEIQSLSFMPVVDSPVFGLSAKFQCTDDTVYHDTTKL